MNLWGLRDITKIFTFVKPVKQFFFSNMKITAKRQRTPNYVELHAWAILSPMRSLYGRKEHLEQAKDINFLVK